MFESHEFCSNYTLHRARNPYCGSVSGTGPLSAYWVSGRLVSENRSSENQLAPGSKGPEIVQHTAPKKKYRTRVFYLLHPYVFFFPGPPTAFPMDRQSIADRKEEPGTRFRRPLRFQTARRERWR